MQSAGAFITLVGASLHMLEKGDTQTCKTLAVVVYHPRGGHCIRRAKEGFLQSAHNHTVLGEDRNEIYLHRWKLTVNISGLDGTPAIVMTSPASLFSFEGQMSTTILRYEGKGKLHKVDRGLIGGLCDAHPEEVDDVDEVCSILLPCEPATKRYYRFESYDCQPVMEMIAMKDGEKLGPWRFERLPELVGECG